MLKYGQRVRLPDGEKGTVVIQRPGYAEDIVDVVLDRPAAGYEQYYDWFTRKYEQIPAGRELIQPYSFSQVTPIEEES